MEQRVELKTWRCGLDRLHGEMGWEFWWIGGEPARQPFVVGRIVDHGLLMICNGWSGKLQGFFGLGEIGFIEMDSSDGL